ncbi:MAG: MGMT family protein [Bacillota bacterium]|nr:MGMT family protein [Bacillota bacterium]
MANEDKKDFNAMLRRDNGMPKVQIVTDEKTIAKYGGEKMYFAPPIAYDEIMKKVPPGKVITVGDIRSYFAAANKADFTDPITAGIFVSIAAWASHQRQEDKTPYWRTLKAKGELNPKYPGGAEAQKQKLESEGHTIIKRGRTNIRYYVDNYKEVLWKINSEQQK